MITRKWLDTK